MTNCRRQVFLILAIAIAITSPKAGFASGATTLSWLPFETAAQHNARMDWFRQAKFGMFIHWGLYCIPARGEWYMRSSKISFDDYSKYAAEFNPVKFDADDWATLAQDAGMKYMVLTAKHHDGFAMFKSYASAYNIVDATPFKRDVVKELAVVCPKHGIRFGTYYSFLSDWGHHGGGAGGAHWDPAAQDGDLHAYIQDIAMPQVKELLTNYGPLSVMWFDSDGAQGMTPAESAQVVKMLEAQPQIIVDPRLPGVKGDFASSEVDVPLLTPKGDWELCLSINPSWGYTGAPAKPLKVLLPYIMDAWGKGGNVLLNVGPDSEGVIAADSTARLHEVGRWLHTYGTSVYGTSAGPFDYLPWGTTTRKGNIVYLEIYDWPSTGRLMVPLSNKITKATLLGPGNSQTLTTSHADPDRLIVNLPTNAPDPIVNVVALTVQGEPQSTYHSVLSNSVVKASGNQNEAQLVVGDTESGGWQNPDPVGWLEFDLPNPVTVDTLRMACGYNTIENYALEYKVGDAWLPIISGGKTTAHQYAVVQSFTPVTAQTFRVHFIQSDQPVRIRHIDLLPPL